ncbi:MAG TPA: sigma factor-like helix-turn-helix DNA-binding protein [bacterium]
MRRTLNDRLRITRLFDAYGRLLTDRQQRLLNLYFHDDLSFTEIAERFEVTRQAVYDALRRSTGELERLEALLGVVVSTDAAARRRRALTEQLATLEASVARLAARVGTEAVGEITHEVAALRRVAR